MSKRLIFEANKTLNGLRRLRADLKARGRELERERGKLLRQSFKYPGSPPYYYRKLPGQPGYEYLGAASVKEVNNIKELRYIDSALDVIERDIPILEKLMDKYIIPDYDTINHLMPKAYRDPVVHSRSALRRDAAKWKQGKLEIKSHYPLYKPEQLIHKAIDGTMLRSKSEMLFANELVRRGITYVTEVPIFINGEMILPDFIILSEIDHRTEVIIEHQGMMDDPDYRDKYIRSLTSYLKSDFVINENLFFTFDMMDGNCDMRQLDSIIRNFIKP